MMQKKQYKFKLLLAFLLILIISIVGFQLLFEKEVYSKYQGYGFSYLCLIIVAVIGSIGFKSYTLRWPRLLWNLIYLTGFIALALFKVTDAFIHKISGQYWGGYLHIQAFFISPFPFLILYFLAEKLGGSNQPSK